MPLFEQGYRPYLGEKSRGSRALAIAWESIRPRMRPWAWVALLIALLPYFFQGVLVFLFTAGATLFKFPTPKIAPAPTTIYAQSFNPGALVSMLQGSSLSLYWGLLETATICTVALSAVLGAGLLASDRRTGGLQVYFSRSVTRRDYLFGKFLTVAGLVAMTTALPSLLIWLETVLLSGSSALSWTSVIAPFAILLGSAIHVVWVAGLLLALSAVIDRPAFVGILMIFLYLLLEGVGATLSRAQHDPAWTVLQPSHALGVLTAPIFGMNVPDTMSVPAAFGVGFCLPAILLAFVAWRVRAVEVVT